MKKDLKYILFLAAGVLLYVLVELFSPEPLDWTISYSHKDKNPFGSYLVGQRLGDLFPADPVNSNLTIYELKDSLVKNLLILSTSFSPAKEDTEALLDMVNEGANAFIASEYYYGIFADTLNLVSEDYFFDNNPIQNLSRDDTARLMFINPHIDKETYAFRRNNTHNYFSSFDTLRSEILVMNDLDKAVMIRSKWGEGNIYLCSTPLAFTNNYLLYQENNEFVSKALSYLPQEKITWTEYYQLGRMEARTPLRYILSSEPLRWSYYIAILSLFLFILFEAKRKQRIIPIITPLANTTLDFVGTISNLYFYKKDHRSIAEKRINFFMDQLRSKYRLHYTEGDESWLEKVARKTGHELGEVKSLFLLVQHIKKQPKISEEQLKELNKKIDDINLS